MKKERLDVLVHARGLAESVKNAQSLILAGQVVVNDQRVDKPGTKIALDAEVRLKGEVMPYVSRGGLKLKGAIDRFSLVVKGATCADIGASTGGFTDCLLQEGATKVYAIDVGWGQLHEKLRRDPRVISKERVNARHLTDAELPEPVQVVVIDVSFISLEAVLPAVLPKLASGGLLIALVKPQFEVEQAQVDKGGVVTDPTARQAAIDRIRAFVTARSLTELGVVDSTMPGPAGNVEALLVARKT
jgi:23S rRNA (cytidine1920-2'-O)/16S rRNA (cytidine1409-2'-O)-methyltransferase